MKKFLAYGVVCSLLMGCSDDEFVTPEFMEFEQEAVLEAWNVHNAGGFLASKEMNSLYIASREANPETNRLGERLLRYNLKDGSVTADYSDVVDFVTKEIHIQGDKITVVGGTFINTYSLDFDSETQTVEHGLSLTRFGSVQYNDDIYIWGGDLNDVDSDKLKKWNATDSRFETIATLPARKMGAHGEVVGNKLYIFGGQEHWLEEPPNDLIIIYDFTSGDMTTSNLPDPIYRTFTDVYQDKIFVAGQRIDYDPWTADFDIFFALFDPEDNSIQEIETSLSDDDFFTIHQLAIEGNDLFVLYGDIEEEQGTIRLMKHKL